MKQIDLDEAVAYLRELLIMNKQELLREVRSDLVSDKSKSKDILMLAFELKFDSYARPPVRGSKTCNPAVREL